MTKTVNRFGITGMVVGLLIVGALSAAAQGLLPQRTLGSRMQRSAACAAQGQRSSNARRNEATETMFDFKDICFRSLLGINDEVLADSDRFPCANDRIPVIELGERFGDFTNATMTVWKDWNTGKLVLSDLKFVKVLGTGADDKALLNEYEHAVDLVGKLLGVSVTCSGFVDPVTYLRCRCLGTIDGRIKSRTLLNLAKGQKVEITATEASYVIREGRPIQTAASIVEIRFGPIGLCRSSGRNFESVKELTLGPDCSNLLSMKMRVLQEQSKQQRQRLMTIQEELRKSREQRQREADSTDTQNGNDKTIASRGASNRAAGASASSVRKEDFKARLTGIAIIEGGRMCGYESRAKEADFQSPDRPIEIPYGMAACFRVEYDFPNGYQARVWTRDRWLKGQGGSCYYFGSNPSPLYKGKGVAYGFLDMLERGKTCTLKQLAIQTNAEPKLEGLSNGWDIVVASVDIKFQGPETVQKTKPTGGKKVVLDNQTHGKNVVAEKLLGCDFLLNKDFKKKAKFYLCLFSASWCPPCRAEMPRIAKTYAETLKADPDIELIHFSCDRDEDKAMAWAKEHDVQFPVVKPKGGNPLDLHTRGIPHLFIVKADGTIMEEGHPMKLFTEQKLSEVKQL